MPLALLTHFIKCKTGIIIQQHQLNSLERTFKDAQRIFGFDSIEQYVTRLQTLPEDAEALRHLIKGITVGESYFFRDKEQMQFLRYRFFPELIAKRRRLANKTIRVWSAACSEGQEIYSIAMILWELLDDIEEWNLHLLGTDINTDALRQAVAGHYSQWAFRTTPEHLQHSFFTKHGQRFALKAAIKQMVRFEFINLASESYPSLLANIHSMDLILCRNVFIYFEAAWIRKVLQRMVTTLSEGGVLLTAPSDLVENRVDGLTCQLDAGMSYFYKAPPPPTSLATCPPPPLPNHTDRFSRLEQWRQLAAARQWQEILHQATLFADEVDRQSELVLLHASALGNLGDHQAALQRCTAALSLAATNPHGYFLQGLLFMESGNLDEAEKSLKKALFLDAFFLEAHYQLGLLLIRRKQRKRGIKCLNNALTLASQQPTEQPLQDEPSMTYGQLVAQLNQEIQLYGNGVNHVC